jgi:hypothetical protein
MAFTKNITLNNGIQLENAYCKIRHIDGNKNFIIVSVEAYLNKDIADRCYEDNSLFLKVWNYKIENIDITQNMWEQCYTYLKTLPEWSDAINC